MRPRIKILLLNASKEAFYSSSIGAGVESIMKLEEFFSLDDLLARRGLSFFSLTFLDHVLIKQAYSFLDAARRVRGIKV